MSKSPYKEAMRKAYKKGYNAGYKGRRNPKLEAECAMAPVPKKLTKQDRLLEDAKRHSFSEGRRHAEDEARSGAIAAKMVAEKNSARLSAINAVSKMAEQMSNLAQGIYRLVEEIHN